jgi:YD repeat-containing protein
VKDGKNQTTTFSYDGLGRITQELTPGSTSFANWYDAMNLVARVDDAGPWHDVRLRRTGSASRGRCSTKPNFAFTAKMTPAG